MITRTGGPRLAILCDQLFRAAQVVDPNPGPERGTRFEQRVERDLLALGFPVRAVPGGVEVLGTLPASGMRHQIDAEAWCSDCDVIGEWKAYLSPAPKNDLMLFKAKTDEIYEQLVARKPYRRPVARVFGIAGDIRPEGRAYAARHGIILIERTRWPAPVLGDPLAVWEGVVPSPYELQALHFLARPMQLVYKRCSDGRVLSPHPTPRELLDAVLRIQARVSGRFDVALAA